MTRDQDLFHEEQDMVTMSFGDHIEELRSRLILALLGLVVGVVITFLPPLNLGMLVMHAMQDPGQKALDDFYTDQMKEKAEAARAQKLVTPPVSVTIPAHDLVEGLRAAGLDLPGTVRPEAQIEVPLRMNQGDVMTNLPSNFPSKNAFISLAPLESITIFMMVCIVTGLVLSSPWVFYQLWAFVAAGLYRHERQYVKKFLPFSLGLFLGGVMLCFFGVLPLTLKFLLQFNVWLGIEPTLRISEWMSFATILPLVFGLAFQTPLVMLFLARIGIFTADDFRAKRKYAILIMVILAAVLTPGPDVASQMMLALPMLALYELGIRLVGNKPKIAVPVGD